MKSNYLKLLITFSLPFFIGISFIGCYKQEYAKSNQQELTISSYTTRTKSIIENSNYIGLAREVDFSTTVFIKNESNGVYYTKLNNSNFYSRALLSIVREDRKVLNYIVVVDKINDTSFNNYLFTLSGKKFAQYSICGGKFSDRLVTFYQNNMKSTSDELDGRDGYQYPFIDEEYTPDPEITATRSWWACTKECISDAHIACYLDRDCISLLIAVNVASGFAKPKLSGLGSISIGAACGVVCAGNTNLDMLPQY